MCSGRVDLEFILRAFLKGLDGVLIGGCRLGECNYITHGNFDALANNHIVKKIMAAIGLNPERLRIEFMSGADGNLLAEVTDDFTRQIQEMGPIGTAEGLDKKALAAKLEAALKLVPFLKLVERERLRVPVKTQKAYDDFFQSSETNALFNELFVDKLAISQILLLLGESPLSTGEISKRLGLSPSEVSKQMKISSRQGWVRYDESRNCFALAL